MIYTIYKAWSLRDKTRFVSPYNHGTGKSLRIVPYIGAISAVMTSYVPEYYYK